MMDSGDEYKFRPNREYQGLAVVIVNFTEERRGSKEDITYMTRTFEVLGFKVKLYKNLSKRRFIEVINYYSKDDTLTDYDSFVLAISTHGLELESANRAKRDYVVHHHALLMNDDQSYYTATILEKFRKCKALKGKPKLFFIQACRIPESKSSKKHRVQGIGFDAGTGLHKLDLEEPNKNKCRHDKTDYKEGSIISREEALDSDPKILSEVEEDAADTAKVSFSDEVGDSWSNSEEVLLDPPIDIGELGDEVDPPRAIRYRPSQAPLHITAVPCHNDMLVVFASPEGHYAIRNEDMGSYMLKYLHDSVINEYGEGRLLNNRTNFLYILNDVAAKMSSAIFCDGKYKNVTCVVHKLSKDIVFSKGENM
ncbi:uncharacterized protein LOC133185825 [Saccostrea echinata]|uniref:uncharacterized protein LOC133185825 n=1 Tax=Saccostrea echinata TaxID=191078 RepID=UPI002A81FBF4|nr:uncharacterized protein LOC133185825 [Saccostrea echinata]